MIWLIIVGAVLLFSFSAVLLVGAPYLPTLKPQVEAALRLADLHKGQTLLELGCGDGRVLIAAAQKGLNVVGYELNPFLALVTYLRTWQYRKQVTVIWGDFWRKPWPKADAIFVFLLPKYMQKLDTKIMQSTSKPVKLVSFAFQIPNKKFDITKHDIYLYKYL